MRCVVGREWNPAHPVCRSCPGPCGNKVFDTPEVISTTGRQKQPNKTEISYKYRLELEFPGCEIKYEAVSLLLDTGFRYTPDLVVFLPGDRLLLVEVKNSGFKHASYGRSKIAFACAVKDFPCFSFRWASKEKGEWKVFDY